jgi:hypothetical protein
MQRTITTVIKKITVLKANINAKDNTIELRIKEKLTWTNADSSTSSSTTIGTMTVSLSDALPNVITDLETFIGTDPVFESVNATE